MYKWILFAAALVAAGCDGSSVVGGLEPRDATVDVTADATMDASVCPSPLLSCNQRCSDPRTDRENCGACGRSCSTGNVCQNGACVPDCGSGETLCRSAGDAGAGLACVSLRTDRANCGACGTACGTNQVCANGTCTFMCTGTTTECTRGGAGMDGGGERYCADLQADRRVCLPC